MGYGLGRRWGIVLRDGAWCGGKMGHGVGRWAMMWDKMDMVWG